MNNNIALADIRAFVTIATCGSFTKAADTLGGSRAHLSRQLSQLESQLGIQLLIRTTRSQRLTDAGEVFFKKCQNALSGIDQAVLEVIDDSKQLHGPIAINCVGGPIGEEIVAPLVGEFSTHYPDIEINLDFSSQRVDLVGDGFDLVIRMGELDDSRFIARKLIMLPNTLFASPKYLAQHGIPEHPKDLKNHNCLTGSLKRWSFQHVENQKQTADVSVSGNFTCKNGRALINSALQNNGIVRVPEFYCEKEFNQGHLVPVFKNWMVAPTPIYLLYHRKKYQPERLKRLIQYLCDHFAKKLK